MKRTLSLALATAAILAVRAAQAQTYVEVTPGAAGVSASTSDTNVAGNAVDGSLTTRWSGNGDGATLQLDLGSTRTVGYVKVAVHTGNTRRNVFEVQALIGTTWTTLWSGSSTGTTTALETYDFADVDARLIRYLGHGATVNAGGTSTWNSVSEVEVFAASSGTTYDNVTPGGSALTASTHDGNVPANAVDGSLATRWSANGDGQWLRLDLGSTRTVAHVNVAFYSGNTRSSQFDVQVSDDGASWTTVRTGAASGGTSTALETFDVTDTPGRYVRYLGHGNSTNTWNSVNEIQVFAVAGGGVPTPTPTPTPATPTPLTPTSTPTPTPVTPTPTPTPTPTTPASSACFDQFNTGAPASSWVFYDGSQRLAYRTVDSRGDKIMDFSHAGYMGGGVALPSAPVRVTLSPTSSGDDTPRIQSAINQVAAMAPGASGIRGAVMLNAGTYRLNGTLNFTVSGVVLRGAGSGTSGTVMNLGSTAHEAFNVAGSGSWTQTGAVNITSSYVPSGGRSFNVSSTSGFAAGQRVIVERNVTSGWVQFMSMHDLVRNGAPQTWIAAGTRIKSDRTITAVSGSQVTLDVPLSDSFDSTYVSGSTLSRYTFSGRISQVGVESIRVVAPAGNPDSPPSYKLISFDAVEDAWAKDLFGQDLRSGASTGDTAKRITMDRVTLSHTYPSNTAAAPGDFGISGTQTLLLRCKSLNAGGAFYALTQATDVGPIVLVDFQATGGTAVQPHQRWATGMLVDRANVSNGAIEYMNRGNLGSGHGWTMGWGVVWNSTAPHYTVQKPQGAQNWTIGSTGDIVDRPEYGNTGGGNLPRGVHESQGTAVKPSSLYLAQLCDRLGPQALTNIGY